MEKSIIFRINKDTEDKLKYLCQEMSGLYPTRSQVIRSAIHLLYNEKIRDEKRKKDIL